MKFVRQEAVACLLTSLNPMANLIPSVMAYHELFNEVPYAASLESKFLAKRCATCFSDGASIPCSKDGCGNAFYCNEGCRKIDQSNHQYECSGFKKAEGAIDPFVRLLGRILTRRLSDCGVAHLCVKFPENIQDRSLGDLLSHQSEIRRCPHRSKDMDESLKEFGRFFAGTPLVNDLKLAKRIYCVMWINCFSVSGDLDMNTGSGATLGLGFYLNISRFNHSCRPDLHVLFQGSRLIILYPSAAVNDDQVSKERLALTRSNSSFNQLTISYGFSSTSSDSYFPLRRHRRKSLKFAYYFTCQCVLCSDKRNAALEEHAAPIECTKCHEPYVWNRRSGLACWLPSENAAKGCRKSCRCASDEKEVEAVNTFVKNVGPDQKLKNLEKEWKRVMSFSMDGQYAEKIIERCDPVWNAAQTLWHRSANLRMQQLQERLFTAHSVLAIQEWKANKKPDEHSVKMALTVGEAVLAWFQRHNGNLGDGVTAAYAYELAQMYEIMASVAGNRQQTVDNFERASYWYQSAASIWSAFGHYASHFVHKLTKAAEESKKATTTVAVEVEIKDPRQ